MKKIILILTLTATTLSFATEWNQYSVSESRFPGMIPVGQIFEVATDFSQMKGSLFGTQRVMDCSHVEDHEFSHYQAMRSELSTLVICGEKTPIAFFNDDEDAEYDNGMIKLKRVN